MDRNERNRRYKQNIDAHNDRRNAQPRSRQPQRSPAPDYRSAPAHRADHAPVYDQDHGRKPAPQSGAKDPKQRTKVTKRQLRRRARRRRMLAVFLVLAAIAAGVVFGLGVLFKVTSITVKNPEGYLAPNSADSTVLLPPASAPPASSAPQQAGEDDADSAASDGTAPTATPEPQPTAPPVDTGPYTQLQITSALGVQLGDNLFGFRLKEKEAQLTLALPLLEQIDLRRQYPNTLVIQVTPAVATWYTPTQNGWLVLSESLKVMEQVADQPQGLCLLLCDAKPTQPGTPLATLSYEKLLAAAQAEAQKKAEQAAASGEEVPPVEVDPNSIRDENRVALDELMAALEKFGLLERVTALDTSVAEEAAFLYEDRICVLLGTTNQMDYKMDWAATILLNEDGKGCSATDTGVLDISNIRGDGTIQPVFRQGEWQLPGQKLAAAAPEADTAPDAEAAPQG